MAALKLSVIIPVYNEEHTIAAVLDKVLAAPLPDGMEKEVLVINDGSTDRTAELLKIYPQKDRVRVLHQKNQGKTRALVRGLGEASGDILIIQDADLEYDPAQYPKLLEPILKGEVSVVYGSRFMGRIEDMRWINRWANQISNWTFHWLYGIRITDINTCYKVFKREVIQGLTIVSRNFAFETEITVKLIKKGVSIREVPIEYVARSFREGKKIRWGTALEMFWPIIRYRFFSGD